MDPVHSATLVELAQPAGPSALPVERMPLPLPLRQLLLLQLDLFSSTPRSPNTLKNPCSGVEDGNAAVNTFGCRIPRSSTSKAARRHRAAGSTTDQEQGLLRAAEPLAALSRCTSRINQLEGNDRDSNPYNRTDSHRFICSWSPVRGRCRACL